MGDQEVVLQQKMLVSKLYRQPTLPHLLQEYGFQNTLQNHSKKTEKREKKKTEKKDSKRSGSFFSDDDKDLDKQREMDDHYVKMVSDMHQLRDYYYNEYTALLGEKVEKQRRGMRERDAKLRNVEQMKEEEQRKASHRVKKRLERHTLETTPATDTVPKTDLYYIIGLEDKLRREGKLKTPSDFNKFRKDMNEPQIFHANFKVNKNADLTSYSGSSADLTSLQSKGESNDVLFEMEPDIAKKSNEQGKQQQRPLSRISETRESPVLGNRRESWAITQQFPSQYRNRKKSLSQANPSKMKSDPLSDLEKRFPKLEMPKLHCFTLNLNKKPPDPEEVRQQEELREKVKGRRKAMRTYTKMYQLAMTNAATTSRIMDNFDDMNLLLQGPNLCDVIADHHWMQAYGLREMDREGTQEENELVNDQSQHCSPIDEAPLDTTGAGSRGGSAVSERSGSKRSRRSTARSKSESPKEEPPQIMPLTMNEIKGNCDIKESKILSTMWSNYLRAGKSSWMTTEP